MATYREALKKFEYDPDSKQTYLQFIGAAYPPTDPAGPIGRQSNLRAPDLTAIKGKSSIDWDWTKQ
jgi:aminobenzoyl-glutamate utilization protein B